jgi:hypothetical protein
MLEKLAGGIKPSVVKVGQGYVGMKNMLGLIRLGYVKIFFFNPTDRWQDRLNQRTAPTSAVSSPNIVRQLVQIKMTARKS